MTSSECPAAICMSSLQATWGPGWGLGEASLLQRGSPGWGALPNPRSPLRCRCGGLGDWLVLLPSFLSLWGYKEPHCPQGPPQGLHASKPQAWGGKYPHPPPSQTPSRDMTPGGLNPLRRQSTSAKQASGLGRACGDCPPAPCPGHWCLRS